MTDTITGFSKWTAGVHRLTLPNGLTVLVERNDSAPVIASVAHVRAGYFDEPDEWVGISHVMEHMYFKGTLTRGPGELARETQLVGGYVNAGTIYDKTIYYTVLPAEPGALEHVVDLQADGLMHSRLDPEELTAELEVIIQEAKRKLDTPSAVTVETLYELLFDRHRIRRWRIGTEEGLRRLSAADVREYYETRYVPSRTVVAIVGPVDIDQTVELVSDRYGAWPGRRVEIPGSPGEMSPPAPARRVLRGDVQRPLVSLGWRTVGPLHEDAVALDIAAQLLSAGRGSWLHRSLRQPGRSSSARAHHYTPGDVGVFDVSLEGPLDRLDEAVPVALGAVERLAAVGPSEDDMTRVAALMVTQWARRMEAMDGRAAMFCEFEALDRVTHLDEMYRQLMDTSAEDVRRVAGQYLAAEGVSGVIYLAHDDAPAVAGQAWPIAPNPPSLTSIRASVLPVRSAVVRDGRRHARGPITVVEQNGADLLVQAKRDTGLVNVSLLAPRLREAEDETNAGVSTLFLRSALRGAGGMDAEQLAQAAERLGGTLTPAMIVGGIGWSITVRRDAVPEAAALLKTIASAAALTEDAIGHERTLQISDARRAEDDMFNHPIRRVLQLALPKSAYGLPTLGDPEMLAALPLEAVRRWADGFKQRRVVGVAVGDDDPTRLIDALGVVADWAGREPWRTLRSTPSWVPGRGDQYREKAQSALAMAFPAPPRGSADRYPMIVLGALLSGLAGRLFEELREKRSLAYTVAALPWQRHDAGCFLTYIAMSPDREEEARDGMLAELTAVANGRFSEEEVDRARRYAAGSFQIRQQRTGSVAAEIYDGWNFGETETAEETVARLRAVTMGGVARVAEQIFREERAEFVLRGSGATVR